MAIDKNSNRERIHLAIFMKIGQYICSEFPFLPRAIFGWDSFLRPLYQCTEHKNSKSINKYFLYLPINIELNCAALYLSDSSTT